MIVLSPKPKSRCRRANLVGYEVVIFGEDNRIPGTGICQFVRFGHSDDALTEARAFIKSFNDDEAREPMGIHAVLYAVKGAAQ